MSNSWAAGRKPQGAKAQGIDEGMQEKLLPEQRRRSLYPKGIGARCLRRKRNASVPRPKFEHEGLASLKSEDGWSPIYGRFSHEYRMAHGRAAGHGDSDDEYGRKVRTLKTRNALNGEIICTLDVGYDAAVGDGCFLIYEWARGRGKKISEGFSQRDWVLMCPKATNPANKRCFPRCNTLLSDLSDQPAIEMLLFRWWNPGGRSREYYLAEEANVALWAQWDPYTHIFPNPEDQGFKWRTFSKEEQEAEDAKAAANNSDVMSRVRAFKDREQHFSPRCACRPLWRRAARTKGTRKEVLER